MYYGLYLSASGVLVNTHNQDVHSNNLANAQTPGFKPIIPGVQQRPAASVEDNLPFDASHDLLDRLGGGVLAAPLGTSFNPGAPERTGRPLDAALTGRNEFFAVQHENTATGQTDIRLTRDGRLFTRQGGELVTASGLPILDPQDRPIKVDPEAGPAHVDARGRIIQANGVVAQLQITQVADPRNDLAPAGGDTFTFRGNDTRKPADDVLLMPGHIETSGVSSIDSMMQIVKSTKAANGNANMIRYQDQMMDRAINTLGRVA